MAVVIKSEWHQVEKRYGLEIDRDLFGEIYSDIEDEGEIDLMFLQFENGELDIDEINFSFIFNVGIDLTKQITVNIKTITFFNLMPLRFDY